MLRFHPMTSLSQEARRLYARYQTEIVETYRLCPWAESARQKGHVAEHVVTTHEEPVSALVDEALAGISAIEERPEVEVGLLLFPRVRLSRSDFDRFVSDLVRADAERRALGAAPFALAAFHPDASADLGDPERLVPFIRRTPDPTVQLVRHVALERVRDGFAEGTQFIDMAALGTLGLTAEDTLPLRDRIARANQRTIERIGVHELERRLDDIRRDREITYARLGLGEG